MKPNPFPLLTVCPMAIGNHVIVQVNPPEGVFSRILTTYCGDLSSKARAEYAAQAINERPTMERIVELAREVAAEIDEDQCGAGLSLRLGRLTRELAKIQA